MISLTHREGYDHSQGARFIFSHTKTRGIPGGAAQAPFEASLGPHGWDDDRIRSSADETQQRLLDVIRQRAESGKPVRNKTEAVESVKGKRKIKLDAWDDLIEAGAIEAAADGNGFVPAQAAAAA